MKIVAGILIAIVLYLNGKHAWSGITRNMKPEEAKMLSDIGLSQAYILPIGIASLLVCLLTVLPVTFFVGNLLNAALILLIMAMALNAGNLKIAVIEIPFLLLPLILIWLGHPLKKS